MVVMEGVCAASPATGGSSDPVSPASVAAINSHRAWYDASALQAQQGEDIDAYFKAGSNASSYFSQMQGAYSGMSSYHG